MVLANPTKEVTGLFELHGKALLPYVRVPTGLAVKVDSVSSFPLSRVMAGPTMCAGWTGAKSVGEIELHHWLEHQDLESGMAYTAQFSAR